VTTTSQKLRTEDVD